MIVLKKVMLAIAIGIMSSATFAASVCYHKATGSVVASNSKCKGAYAPLNVKSFIGMPGAQGIQGIPGPNATFAPTACAQSDLAGNWFFTDAGVINGYLESCVFSVGNTGNSLGGECSTTRIDGSTFTTRILPGGFMGFRNLQSCDIAPFVIFLSNGNVLTMYGIMSPTKMEAVFGLYNNNFLGQAVDRSTFNSS